MSLPPGQRYREDFPRFGLDQFADRVVEASDRGSIAVGGDVAQPLALDREALASLPRVEQTSDFHCVTTWSSKDLQWAGWRFSDVYERLIKEHASPRADIKFVKLTARDGYRCVLRLDDALADDVLLADTLNGQPFMDHLRARVALEERGQLPAWLLRLLYRPLIGRTVRKFRRALG